MTTRIVELAESTTIARAADMLGNGTLPLKFTEEPKRRIRSHGTLPLEPEGRK
jgi:hypothetical protein